MGLVKKLLLMTIAPLLGMFLGIALFYSDTQGMLFPFEKTDIAVSDLSRVFNSVLLDLDSIVETAQSQENQYRDQQEIIDQISDQVSTHTELSDQIYEDKILAMLGKPVYVHTSQRVEIKIFQLAELGYRGYIAKAKLFDPSALKVVLAKDTPGEKETTMDAVVRTGAVFGINGGGFYTEMRDGKPYTVHIGNVVIDGKLITPFNSYPGTLHFAGINQEGRFTGGIYSEEEQLMSLKPLQGVSFTPILIKGGLARPIDPEWEKTKHPRTIMGEYANGDLIFIVVDGRQDSWSSGATLERLLEKLVELGVKEGYNLDGGGSSAMVYKDKMLNRPSDGKARPVVSNIIIMP